jgi:hypothetical protein
MRSRVCWGFVSFWELLEGTDGFLIFDFVDAEECWGKITEALKDIPLESGSQTTSKKFVEAYMTGQMRRELRTPIQKKKHTS